MNDDDELMELATNNSGDNGRFVVIDASGSSENGRE